MLFHTDESAGSIQGASCGYKYNNEQKVIADRFHELETDWQIAMHTSSSWDTILKVTSHLGGIYNTLRMKELDSWYLLGICNGHEGEKH